MSELEYNNLLYQISKKFDELNVGEQLLVMLRRKVAARSGEDFQTFSLFEELEQKGFLSPSHLGLLKGMLKEVNEWALFDEVEKFETKRKEYNNLLEPLFECSTSSMIWNDSSRFAEKRLQKKDKATFKMCDHCLRS